MVPTISRPETYTPVQVKVVDYSTHRADIHQVRHRVFVCEQHVPQALEVDAYDPLSIHVLAQWEGWAVGTGRLAPDGRIGRVAVAQPLRRRGVGRQVMEHLLEVALRQGHPRVVLSAQCHAIAFYEKLGFYTEGPVFEQMGIPHITMWKSLVKAS
ncbi:MAG: GNAT family N-acetyltransferase [Leptolyngbyaceae cyanobacterium T60_A2020_046]|nr:GNAT family N-acetyltransferase [Leptolyngbyaceae cyanobacterium T60_A2020_046]